MARTARSATTVYLDPRIARAAKVKAAVSGKSLSDLANEGLIRILGDDERDLRLIRQRQKGKFRDYESFLAELKRDGLLYPAYRIEIEKRAEAELLAVPFPFRRQLNGRLFRLKSEPHPADAERIDGESFRLLVGGWRILYDVDEALQRNRVLAFVPSASSSR